MSRDATHALKNALALFADGDRAAAEHACQQVLKISAGSGDDDTAIRAQAHHVLGLISTDAGQNAAALVHLKAAVTAWPHLAQYWISYACALMTVGRASEAVAAFEDARTRGATDQDLADGAAVAAGRKEVISLFAPDLAEILRPYYTLAAGHGGLRAELALSGANRVPLLLAQLAGLSNAKPAAIEPIENICVEPSARAAATRLAHLFTHHGSDKSTTHNYENIYGAILRDPVSVTAILEIGLGTNNTDVVSNMSETGHPGASLRAFRDYLPRARIYGADVDRRILFTDERITTFYVDQIDPATFDDLAAHLPDELDLIIDDGLHAPDANLTSLLFGLKKVKVGGWIVIEDVAQAAVPIWQAAAALLPAGFTGRILLAKRHCVFAVQRLP